MGGILTKILGPIFSVIDKAIPDKTKALELKSEIEKQVLENQAAMQETMREIAVKEVAGSAFQRNWRPLLSYTVIFSMWWVILLRPIIDSALGVNIGGPTMSDLIPMITVWTGVYGIGRTIEKTGMKIGGG